MRRLALATLGASGLAAIFMGVGLLAVVRPDYVPGHYPSSMHVVSEHFNLLSAYEGYIRQEGVYETGDDVMNVWRWYAKQFGVEPTGGMNAEGRCVQLSIAKQYALLWRTIEVRLCSVARGTRVFFNQTVYLRP